MSKRPTHNVVINRDGVWYTVGVGWPTKKEGGITMKLNPFLDLSRLRPEESVQVFKIGTKPPESVSTRFHRDDDDVDDVFGEDPPGDFVASGSPPYR